MKRKAISAITLPAKQTKETRKKKQEKDEEDERGIERRVSISTS